jgi:hypothetical protein
MNFKPIVLFFFLLLAMPVFAGEKIFYHLGPMTIVFTKVDGFLLNLGCQDKKCEAYEKAKKFDNEKIPSELLRGGKNPRAVRCKVKMGGSVVIAQDDEGNQQSMCRFADDSFLI